MAEETDFYSPASEFLMLVRHDEAPLSGSPQGDANLALLIDFMRDDDKSNRDWAALLLSQTEFDTPAIRAALLAATADVDPDVRSEALIGLAKRDRTAATPLVAAALCEEWIGDNILEAAEYVADASLIPALRAITPGDSLSGWQLDRALDSCASGVQPPWRDFDD